jgi:hypothetical protein
MRTHVYGFCLLVAPLLGCGAEAGDPKPDRCKNSICGPSGSGADAGGGTRGSAGAGGAGGGKGGAGGASGSTSGSAGDAASGGQGGSNGATGGGASGGDAGTGEGGTGGTSANESGGSAGTTGGSQGGGTGGATGGASGTGGSAGSMPCQGEACGPIAVLDMDFYQCNVEPIFDRSCAMLGCHGSEARPFRLFARGRLRHDEDLTTAMNPAAQGCIRSGTVNLAEMGTGTVMCEGWTRHTATEWQLNFESASSFKRVEMDPDDSELLSQATEGGLPHVNVHPFQKDDASYTLIHRWLSGEKLGRACNPEFN